MVGQVALDDHLAGFLGAPGAAGDLDDQLGHALAGAKVGVEQPAVGIENRHQGHAWEVVALGEHLGADQYARLAALHGVEQGGHGLLARGAVAVHAQYRNLREENAQALFGALGAGTDRAQVDVVAGRAVARLAFDLPAVVAAQLAGALVHGHPRVATRTFRQPAAVVAEQGRGETAAVEKHQYLLAGGQGLGDSLLHGRGDAGVEWPTFHVQSQEPRLLGAAGALVQVQHGVTAAVGVVQTFHGGRGRAEQDRNVVLVRSHHGQVAGVVAQALLLFVGGVMFFIDDDQAGALHRREQRRARADDDVGLAIAGGQPGVQALAVVDSGMQQGDPRIEAPLEARQGLRAEVDLRDQHQGLLAGFQGLADQLQVDLGLAAAGHSGEEEGIEAAEAGADGFGSRALLRVQWQFRFGQPVEVAVAGGMPAYLDAHQALLVQQAEAVLVQLQLAKQLLGDAVRVLGDGLQGLALARRAAQARIIQLGAFGQVPETFLANLRRLALTQQHRQRPAEGVAQAVLVILRRPQAQLEQRGRQRRLGIEQLQGGFELADGNLAVIRYLDQNADQLAPAKGYAQPCARLQGAARHTGRRPVVEQAAQRRGQSNAQNGVGHAVGSRQKGAILARGLATAGVAVACVVAALWYHRRPNSVRYSTIVSGGGTSAPRNTP